MQKPAIIVDKSTVPVGTADEVEKIIEEVMSSLQIEGEKDMGRVMGVVMPKVKGKADGKLVQQKVKEHLSRLQ